MIDAAAFHSPPGHASFQGADRFRASK